MKFSDCELRPGWVTRVEDSKGTVKARVPGLWQDGDPDAAPPITPLMAGPGGGYSSPEVGDPIWVLSWRHSPLFLKYVRRPEAEDDLDGGEAPEGRYEQLMRRRRGMGTASIAWSDKDGFSMSDGGAVTVSPDAATIGCADPEMAVKSERWGITLGRGDQPALKGDDTYELLEDMLDLLGAISNACTTPYTAPIKTIIDKQLPALKKGLEDIRSTKVRLD
jgi:hypothetical protein